MSWFLPKSAAGRAAIGIVCIVIGMLGALLYGVVLPSGHPFSLTPEQRTELQLQTIAFIVVFIWGIVCCVLAVLKHKQNKQQKPSTPPSSAGPSKTKVFVIVLLVAVSVMVAVLVYILSQPGSFSISLEKNAITIERPEPSGGPVWSFETVVAHIDKIGNYGGWVNLDATVFPAREDVLVTISWGYNPSGEFNTPPFDADVSVGVMYSAPVGDYTITVTATGGLDETEKAVSFVLTIVDLV